jgi:hypothetical protein
MILLVIASSGSLKIFQNSRTSSHSLSLGKKIGVKEPLDSAILKNVKELSLCLKGLVVLWAGNLISLATTDSGSLNISEIEDRPLCLFGEIIQNQIIANSSYFKPLKDPPVLMILLITEGSSKSFRIKEPSTLKFEKRTKVMNIKNHLNTQWGFDALSKSISTNTLHIILWMKISKNHLEKKHVI